MRDAPLDAATAAAYIKRLGEHIDHNINIMDREGVIIASRDQSRVGSFHDAAKRLVDSGAAIESVEPGRSLPSGVRPGVNLPVVHRGETIGVVGVTGEPALVTALAYAIKTSLESMIELEAFKDTTLKRQDSKHVLMSRLLYEDDAPRALLENLFRTLGYDPSLPRLPLLLAPPPGTEAGEALRRVKRSRSHGAEDLSFPTAEGYLLVFVALGRDEEGGVLGGIEAAARGYTRAAFAELGGGELQQGRAWVGAPQRELGRYRTAYRQLLWLAGRFPEPGAEPVFLHDRLLDYLASRIPRAELVAAMDGILALLPEDSRKGLGPLADSLADAALNGKEAAARLGVHRNTLAARADRAAKLLGRDPRRDQRALEFLRLLVRYTELGAPKG